MNNLNVKAPTIKLSVDVQSMLAGGSPNLKSLFNYFLICVALFNIVYVPTYLPTYLPMCNSSYRNEMIAYDDDDATLTKIFIKLKQNCNLSFEIGSTHLLYYSVDRSGKFCLLMLQDFCRYFIIWRIQFL